IRPRTCARSSPAHPPPASQPIDIDDRSGKRLRSFLWEVVSDAAIKEAVRVLAGKFPGIRPGIRVWRAISITFKRDCRHSDDGTDRKLLFRVVVLRSPF